MRSAAKARLRSLTEIVHVAHGHELIPLHALEDRGVRKVTPTLAVVHPDTHPGPKEPTIDFTCIVCVS